MSQRKDIRAAVIEALTSAVTDVSGRVFASRSEVLDDVELPAICVYTRDDEVTTQNQMPAFHERSLKIAVEILVKGTGSIDDEVDDIAEIVEATLLASEFQSMQSKAWNSIELDKTEIGFLDQGRKPIGAARLTFEFGYMKTFQ